MIGRNECPHPKCDVLKPCHLYSCRKHWFELPKPIRLRIWEGYEKSSELWLRADAQAKAYWNGKPE